jgi:hypothetical protein
MQICKSAMVVEGDIEVFFGDLETAFPIEDGTLYTRSDSTPDIGIPANQKVLLVGPRGSFQIASDDV